TTFAAMLRRIIGASVLSSSFGIMRLLWLGAATFTGALAGLCISAGDYIALFWAAVLLVGVGALSQVVSDRERGRDLLALAIVAALLIFDTTRRLFGRTAGFVAAALVAFMPSLILWSSLNLKDALTIALAMLAVWAAVRFQSRPRPLDFVLQFAAAQALIS